MIQNIENQREDVKSINIEYSFNNISGNNMTKIVRAFIINEKPAYTLIKTVTEAGALDTVANAFGYQKKEKKKDDASNVPDYVPEDRSFLAHVASRTLTVPSGKARVVMHLSRVDFTENFLQPNGAHGKVDGMTDDDINQIKAALDADSESEIDGVVVIKDPITLAKQITSVTKPNQITALFNVSKSLLANLKSAKDVNAAKQALKHILDHSNYFMALDNGRAKTAAPAVDKAHLADDEPALIKAFNPYIIEQYTIKNEIVAAKNEWNDAIETARDAKQLASQTKAEKEAAAREEARKDAHLKIKQDEVTGANAQDNIKQAEKDLAKSAAEKSAENKAATEGPMDEEAFLKQLNIIGKKWKEASGGKKMSPAQKREIVKALGIE